MIIGKAAH